MFLAGLFVVLLFLVLVARLLWLQVISYDKYQSKAEDNRITIVPLVPNRAETKARLAQAIEAAS